MPLDEKALRRPTFDESASAPVVLPDGQTWWLPKPHVRCTQPRFKNRKVESVAVVTDDPEYDELLKVVDEASTFVAIANMAAFLVCKNYDISDDQLNTLLEFPPPGDVSPDRWTMRVLAIAYGYDSPKAGSDGSG